MCAVPLHQGTTRGMDNTHQHPGVTTLPTKKAISVVIIFQSKAVIFPYTSDSRRRHLIKSRQFLGFGKHDALTALGMEKRNLDFAAVHDSFWTHARNIIEILRGSFVYLYNGDALEDLELPDLTKSSTISASGQELKLPQNVNISI